MVTDLLPAHRAGDFVRGGFVTCARYQPFDKDQLRVEPSGVSQMLQEDDSVFVRPVVENPAYKEDCGAFLLLWLRVEEAVALRNSNIGEDGMRRTLQLHASRVERVGPVFLPVLR